MKELTKHKSYYKSAEEVFAKWYSSQTWEENYFPKIGKFEKEIKINSPKIEQISSSSQLHTDWKLLIWSFFKE